MSPCLRRFFQEFATYERLSTVITEEQLRQDGFGDRPKFQVLIAEIDGLPAGYALFFDCYSSLWGRGMFLEDLLVRPQFRGKNVGRALLAHVARLTAAANGFGLMFNVLDWNDGAIQFYRKIGATFLDAWKQFASNKKRYMTLRARCKNHDSYLERVLAFANGTGDSDGVKRTAGPTSSLGRILLYARHLDEKRFL